MKMSSISNWFPMVNQLIQSCIQHNSIACMKKPKAKYPSLVNRQRVLFQRDNAKPHTSIITKEKIEELWGIEYLPHPAYSPDLAPSDYYLFRSMAHYLSGRNFTNVKDVEVACLEFFSSISKEWYLSGIQELTERWLKTIEHNGLYFDIWYVFNTFL